MSIITFPSNIYVTRMRLEQMRMDLAHTSPQSGVTQAVSYGLPRWKASIEIERLRDSDVGAVKALLMKLKGQINQLALWDLGRPAPLGTITGTLTLSSAAALGDDTLTITGGTNGQTFKAGDWIGIGSDQNQQLVMVTDDATVSTGTVTVNIQPPLRTAHLSGASVTIDKPKALFRVSNPIQGWDYEGQYVSGFTLDLIEDWQA
jgi:hypothetical protein